MSNTQVTRTYKGAELPAAGVYVFDPAHSLVSFSARHLMVSKVRGSFAPPSGSFIIAEDPTQSGVEVEIDVNSVSTNDDTRDGHLRSPDFFDVENFPTMRFVSTSVKHVKGDHWELAGDLTIKGVTKPVTLDLEVEGAARDPWGNTKIGFTATAELDREDWGLSWNQTLETGGVLVGKKIKLEIAVEAAPQAAGSPA